MKNSELLASNLPNELLGNLDQQRRFLLKEASFKNSCPNCGFRQNQFEAAGISIDEWDFHKTRTISESDPIRKTFIASQAREKNLTISGANAYEFHCVQCKRQLVETVPLVRVGPVGWNWVLVPIDVVAA